MADESNVSVNEELITEVSTTVPVEVIPLDQTLAAIQFDAHLNPEQYLEESEVPGGGE